MSFSSEGAFLYSFPADVDMSNEGAFLYTPVCISPAQNVAGVDQGGASAVPFASGKTVLGVLMNNPKQGEGATYCFQGIMRARCVGAWTMGQNLTAAAGGFQPAGSSDPVFGIALNNAVVGDIGVLQK